MRKSEEKLAMAGLKIPESQKNYLQRVAKERGITFSRLLLDGATIMAGFDLNFLNQLADMAKTTKTDISKVITHLLLTYVSQDSANLKVWGRSKTYNRAFQYDEKGMITGTELSDKVYENALDDAENLKNKLIDSAAKKDETLFISQQNAADLALIVPKPSEIEAKQQNLWQ